MLPNVTCPTCLLPFTPKQRSRVYCSMACRRAFPGKPVADRFWPKVDKDGPVPDHRPDLGPCWVWTGAVDRGPGKLGYGLIWASTGGHEYAHRRSWMLAVGPIPDGLNVLHHCDRPLCVRPDHLFLGTHRDNHEDMVAKGRNIRGERHPWRTRPELVRRGERRWNATMTDAIAGEIKALLARGDMSQRAIARKYGIHYGVVWTIAKGRAWKHV